MTPEECMAEYGRRNNTRRFADVAPLIADDAVFFFNDGTHKGIAAIQKAFEDTWAWDVSDESYSIEDLYWVAAGESVAACTYQYLWEGSVAGRPRALLGKGRGTNVLYRNGDRWQVVHEHLSADPDPRRGS